MKIIRLQAMRFLILFDFFMILGIIELAHDGLIKCDLPQFATSISICLSQNIYIGINEKSYKNRLCSQKNLSDSLMLSIKNFNLPIVYSSKCKMQLRVLFIKLLNKKINATIYTSGVYKLVMVKVFEGYFNKCRLHSRLIIREYLCRKYGI